MRSRGNIGANKVHSNKDSVSREELTKTLDCADILWNDAGEIVVMNIKLLQVCHPTVLTWHSAPKLILEQTDALCWEAERQDKKRKRVRRDV